MKCQVLSPGKNVENISKCRLLKFSPRALTVKRLLKIDVCNSEAKNFISAKHRTC